MSSTTPLHDTLRYHHTRDSVQKQHGGSVAPSTHGLHTQRRCCVYSSTSKISIHQRGQTLHTATYIYMYNVWLGHTHTGARAPASPETRHHSAVWYLYIRVRKHLKFVSTFCEKETNNSNTNNNNTRTTNDNNNSATTNKSRPAGGGGQGGYLPIPRDMNFMTYHDGAGLSQAVNPADGLLLEGKVEQLQNTHNTRKTRKTPITHAQLEQNRNDDSQFSV